MRCERVKVYPDKVVFETSKVNDRATEEYLDSLCKEVGLDRSSGTAYENYIKKNIDKATVFEKEFGYIKGKILAASFRKSQKLVILCVESGSRTYDLSVDLENFTAVNFTLNKDLEFKEFFELLEREQGVTSG